MGTLTCKVGVPDGILVILALKSLQNDGHEEDQQDVVAKDNPRQDENKGTKVGVTGQVELDVVIVLKCQHLHS